MPGEAPTMIIPQGADIQVDIHGQLSISTPGNLVIQNSGNYRKLESLNGSIRIEPMAEVEAVEVRCASTCYVEGTLTAWRVEAEAIHLEDSAQANIVLQETRRLDIGKDARLVGNFANEKELFLLLSRFARQLRALPLFGELGTSETPKELPPDASPKALAETLRELDDLSPERLGAIQDAEVPAAAETTAARSGGGESEEEDHSSDPLFFALVLLEREFTRAAYGPTSQRAIEQVIRLLQEGDHDTLRSTYRSLFNRVVEPGQDVRRAYELIDERFHGE
ncbi:MAG: hypothetical protein OES32_01455 [Acidobacteriota bacterium]|nr:hypothetical protein [Acidobacteriota bacterium]MDH3522228.1 hypothetical protein [Acidobacteriota bacterium]